jgi:hypothetical protein
VTLLVSGLPSTSWTTRFSRTSMSPCLDTRRRHPCWQRAQRPLTRRVFSRGAIRIESLRIHDPSLMAPVRGLRRFGLPPWVVVVRNCLIPGVVGATGSREHFHRLDVKCFVRERGTVADMLGLFRDDVTLVGVLVSTKSQIR